MVQTSPLNASQQDVKVVSSINNPKEEFTARTEICTPLR
jgi:hypothetical protein